MWIWLILLTVTVGVAYLSTRPADCVIRSRNGHVVVKGRMTRAQQFAVEEFLAARFAEVARLRIDVHYPKADRRLRVSIRGPLSEGERQMIRNFFYVEF